MDGFFRSPLNGSDVPVIVVVVLFLGKYLVGDLVVRFIRARRDLFLSMASQRLKRRVERNRASWERHRAQLADDGDYRAHVRYRVLFAEIRTVAMAVWITFLNMVAQPTSLITKGLWVVLSLGAAYVVLGSMVESAVQRATLSEVMEKKKAVMTN